jgi:hypothetical protein
MTGRPTPDPSRVGGIGWLEATNGTLTGSERRRLLAAIARGQAAALAGRVKVAVGRRPDRIAPVPAPPDSALARAAIEACAEQPSSVIGHSHRTWAFGRALAAVDGEARLDEELFYVAALLHDTGLLEAVVGEDFTLRSGRIAAACASGYVDEAGVRRVQDAIAVHTTPGVSVSDDGAEGFYVQAGATLDLGGLRLADLAAAQVEGVLADHPRTGLTDDIVTLIRAEAAAVPDGRFALLKRTGFLPAIRFAPFDQR